MKLKKLTVIAGLAAGLVASAAAPLDSAAVADALAALPKLDYGTNVSRVQILEQAAYAGHTNEALRVELENGLIKVLGGDSTRAAKDFACRQLSVAGGKAAVPALGALLTAPELSHLARYALARIPAPEAAAALREALPKTTGALKIGIINTLGFKADPAAVPVLIPALKDASPEIVAAASLALGRLATAEAIQALRQFKTNAPPALQAEANDALFKAAQGALARRDRQAAAEIYGMYYPEDKSPVLRGVGLAGLVLAVPEGSPYLLEEALKSSDVALHDAAGRILSDWPGKSLPRMITTGLPGYSPEAQVVLLSAIRAKQDLTARTPVLALAEKSAPATRLAAVETLGVIGSAADIPLLARAAVAEDKALRPVARRALAALPGEAVNASLVAAVATAEPPLRAEFIRALGARNVKEAAAVASKYVQDKDPLVRQAAIAALGELRDEKQIPALVKILTASAVAADRQAAEGAIETLCRNTTGNVAEYLAAGLKEGDAQGQAALLRLLQAVGDNVSLALVRQAANDARPELKDAAIRALADWPEVGAAPDLLNLARATGNPLHHTLALRGYFRLVRETEMKPAERFAMITAAADLAKTSDEKKLVVAALSEVMNLNSLKLVVQYLSVPELADEAAAAAIGILGRASDIRKEPAVEILNKVIAAARNPALQEAARKQLARFQAAP